MVFKLINKVKITENKVLPLALSRIYFGRKVPFNFQSTKKYIGVPSKSCAFKNLWIFFFLLGIPCATRWRPVF